MSCSQRESISNWIKNSPSKYHTEENVRNRISYPSDVSETRISNAYMVSTGRSPLPHVRIGSSENIHLMDIIDDFQMLVAQASNSTSDETTNTRCMLNVQTYESKSKPVPWHMDGEYFQTIGNSTRLVEGLVPAYVAVYTVENEGIKGTEILDMETDEEISIDSFPGDMLIFSNTRMLHSVEELDDKRMIFGLRNFDHNPYHYNQTSGEKVFNRCFSGLRKRISTEEATQRHQDFIAEWKHNCDTNGVDEAKF